MLGYHVLLCCKKSVWECKFIVYSNTKETCDINLKNFTKCLKTCAINSCCFQAKQNVTEGCFHIYQH